MLDESGENPTRKAGLTEVVYRAPLGTMILSPREDLHFLAPTWTRSLDHWHEPFIVDSDLGHVSNSSRRFLAKNDPVGIPWDLPLASMLVELRQ